MLRMADYDIENPQKKVSSLVLYDKVVREIVFVSQSEHPMEAAMVLEVWCDVSVPSKCKPISESQ